MAEETNTGVTVENAATESAAAAPVAKKTRGLNRKKPAAEAVAAATTAEAPVKKIRAKRGEKAAEVQLAKAAKAEKATKAPRVAAVAKPVADAPAPVTAAAASDEFSDLLKLEEENKLLRKELGYKLRTENADLKKKLGKS
ncbi:SyrB-like regulator [Neorhizobium sp. BT27B]|uniref:SyrB-like regulator n=1 Tax=Neorhizobium sp. BT27B TaxID=3142625 RepID=UPI003D2A839B